MSNQYYPLYNLGNNQNLLSYINNMLEHFFNQFEFVEMPMMKMSNQIAYAFGTDLDGIAFLYGITRYTTEDDVHLRNRIIATYLYRTPATKNAIEQYFDVMYGYRPLFHEYFSAAFYLPGQTVEQNVRVGYFSLLMPLNTTQVQEVNYANNDGNVTPLNFDIDTSASDVPEVYLYTDHAHITNYATGAIVNGDIICSPTLPVGTKVMVYYTIIPDYLFDTISETESAYEIYLNSVDRMKAAGVEVDLAYYWTPLHDWFHGDIDDLLLTDYGIETFVLIPPLESVSITYENFIVNDGTQYILENILSGTRSESYIYAPSKWGSGKWGRSKWQNWALMFPSEDV